MRQGDDLATRFAAHGRSDKKECLPVWKKGIFLLANCEREWLIHGRWGADAKLSKANSARSANMAGAAVVAAADIAGAAVVAAADMAGVAVVAAADVAGAADVLGAECEEAAAGMVGADGMGLPAFMARRCLLLAAICLIAVGGNALFALGVIAGCAAAVGKVWLWAHSRNMLLGAATPLASFALLLMGALSDASLFAGCAAGLLLLPLAIIANIFTERAGLTRNGWGCGMNRGAECQG
jgi:hypothetical protein